MRVLVRNLPFALFPTLLFVACSDSGSGVGKLRGKVDAPAMIDFGSVQVGIVQPMTFTVKNVGTGVLNVKAIHPADTFSNNAYEFKLSDTNAFPLAPQQGKMLTVTFQPFTTMQDPVSSSFTLETDVPADQGSGTVTLQVTVKGQGVASGLLVEPNPKDFGKVLAGSSSTADIRITNKLSIAVDVTTRLDTDNKPTITTSGGTGRFEIVSPVTMTGSLLPMAADGSHPLLQPNASVKVTIRYVPDPSQDGHQDNGRWTIANCSSPLCEVTVPLTGIGTNTALSCAPANLEFGQVNPNVQRTMTATCTNVSTDTVNITGWHLGPGTTPEFTVAPYTGTPSTLDPNRSFGVRVKFAPTLASIGHMTIGSVLIDGRNLRANRDLSSTRIGLTGEAGGPKIAVNPTSIDFGQVALGTASTRRILVQNTGYGPLTVAMIDPDSAHTGAYTTDFSGSMAIAAGAAQVVQITFRPTVMGTATSTVIITSNDTQTPMTSVRVTGNSVSLPPCMYTLQPSQVNFGIVQLLHEQQQAVQITNTGQDPRDICLINDVMLDPAGSSAFGLANGAETGIMLQPGDSHVIPISFTPAVEGAATGTLHFYISDPTNSNPTVPVRGVGSSSALLITPDNIDFGHILVNCSTSERPIEIFNIGSNPTTIVKIELPAGVTTEFSLNNLPSGIPAPPGTGVMLMPGSSTQFTVKYHANDLGIDQGMINVWEQGRSDPYVVPIVGAGSTDATNVDTFTQLSTPKVDILFVIDNSGSMAPRQANLANNFGSFIQFAQSQSLDYRIATVSSDVQSDPGTPGPCNNDPQRASTLAQGQCGYFATGSTPDTGTPMENMAWRIITPHTQPSPEMAFQQVINQGSRGSAYERGLEAAYQALTGPKITTGWNSGFIRSDAYLAIIIVSDDDDSKDDLSGVTAPGVPPVSFYVNFFRSIKGFRNTNLFSLSAIVEPPWSMMGQTGPSCPDSSGEWPGFRYIQAANQTGGVIESICVQDWSQSLQNLGLAVFGYKSRFILTNTPVPGTIVIKIDGHVIDAMAPSGQIRWTYDAPTNSVNFSPLAIPEPGSQITITYSAQCL